MEIPLLLNGINKKQNMYKRLKKEPKNDQLTEQYSKAEIKIRTLIYEAKQNYCQNCIILKKLGGIQSFLEVCKKFNEHQEIRERLQMIRIFAITSMTISAGLLKPTLVHCPGLMTSRSKTSENRILFFSSENI